MDDGVSRLLRGLQDPREARPDIHRARHQGLHAGSRDQRSDGKTVLAEGGPVDRSAGDREGHHARVRGRARAADRRHCLDIKSNGLDSQASPQMFVAQAQVPDAANALNVGLTPISWIVRTQTPPQTLSGTIQDQLRQATGLPVSDIKSMDDIVSVSVSRQRFNMWVMSVFGGCALLLAAIGLYCLLAYSLEQRTH